MVKILFQPNGNTLDKLLKILQSIKGNVYIMKENDSRRVKNTLIGLFSLNLHFFDNICIITDSKNAELENVKRQIKLIT